MEIIKKTINLEPFKNRFSGIKIPVCDNSDTTGTKWGKIPKDLVINNPLIRYEKTLPLIRDIVTKKPILRFKRAIEILSFLKKFINQSLFYVLCKRDKNLQWVIYDKDVLSDNKSISEIKGVFEELPPIDDFNIGDVIWVGKGADEFLKMFRIGYDTLPIAIRYAKYFANYLLNAFYGEQIIETSVPYLPIPILITQDYDDMGIMSPAIGEWIPNKKYYLGERVVYEEDSYCLKLAPLIDENGKRYYKGNFVPEDKITYFDDFIDGKLVLNHWEKIRHDTSKNKRITGYAESRLCSLIRYKKDYDDDGNELPFVFKENEDGIKTADLLYVVGLKFTRIIEGITFCDCITNIDINNGKITFTYYIGAQLKEDGSIDENSGIKYVETYPYTVKTWSGYYDKHFETVDYIEINYINQIWDPSLTTEIGKIYALIEYPISNSEDFIEIPYIKRDSLIGVQDYNSNIDNIKIIRGKSAAFELHNILGEIQTFEDLEAYRNDFFNVKNNEIR